MPTLNSVDTKTVDRIIQSALTNPYKTPFCQISLLWALEEFTKNQVEHKPGLYCNIIIDFIINCFQGSYSPAPEGLADTDASFDSLRRRWTRSQCHCAKTEPVLSQLHTSSRSPDGANTVTSDLQSHTTFEKCLERISQILAHNIRHSSLSNAQSLKRLGKETAWGAHMKKRSLEDDNSNVWYGVIGWVQRVDSASPWCILGLLVMMMLKDGFWVILVIHNRLLDTFDRRLREALDGEDDEPVKSVMMNLPYFIEAIDKQSPQDLRATFFENGAEERAELVFRLLERYCRTFPLPNEAFYTTLLSFGVFNLQINDPQLLYPLPDIVRLLDERSGMLKWTLRDTDSNSDYTAIIRFTAASSQGVYHQCHNGLAHNPNIDPHAMLLPREAKLSRCGSCQVAQYCSKDCQIKMWTGHKPFCKNLKRFRQAKLEYDEQVAKCNKKTAGDDVITQREKVSFLDAMLEKVQLEQEECELLVAHCRQIEGTLVLEDYVLQSINHEAREYLKRVTEMADAAN